MVELPVDEAGIDAFLGEFEGCVLPKARWSHAAHLLTGACYVHALGEAAALERMRARVRAYNVSVGGQNTETAGYHETVTRFWIGRLAALRRECAGMERARFVWAAVERFGSGGDGGKAELRRWYSFDVVGSREARAGWVAPDLRPEG